LSMLKYSYHVYSLTCRRLATSTLFPYTTLFRSAESCQSCRADPSIGRLDGGRAPVRAWRVRRPADTVRCCAGRSRAGVDPMRPRSEEHTSELQSREKLVCRLLLEKKKYEERDSS